jgi:hypothetical protein
MLVFLVAAVGATLLAGPAQAQPADYPPGPAGIEISNAALSCPGEEFTVVGEGFVPGSSVDLFIDGDQVATVTADQNGEFSVTIQAPDLGTGQHTVTAESSTGQTASATVTCVGAAAVAFTGRNISLGLVLLVVLLAVGAAALFAGRRRARVAR